MDDRKIENFSFVSLFFVFIEDDEDQDNLQMPGAGPIAMHASNHDDPLLEIKDDVRLFSS
jgi:hypothetical protein